MGDPLGRNVGVGLTTNLRWVARTVKIVVQPADEARAEVRAVLDAFETTYGVPSERLMEVFLGSDGRLEETEDFHAWDEAWAHWQILNGL